MGIHFPHVNLTTSDVLNQACTTQSSKGQIDKQKFAVGHKSLISL